MIKLSILAISAAAALAGCSTTQREEVRRDQRDLEEQHRDVAAAMRDGTANEVREEQADVRKAEKELSHDRSELYSAGSEAAALRVGDHVNGSLSALPEKLSGRYVDGVDSYYRSDGRMIYRIGTTDRTVTAVYPITP